MTGLWTALMVAAIAAAVGFWFRIGWAVAGSVMRNPLLDIKITVHEEKGEASK